MTDLIVANQPKCGHANVQGLESAEEWKFRHMKVFVQKDAFFFC